jgi:Trk-type K+ transport system membrane component
MALLPRLARARTALTASAGPLRAAQVVVAGYAATIAVGAFLLSLPAASAGDRSVPAADAVFTATSAVCITGLSVVDMGSAWSTFGLVVIVVLVQLGGLGILTVAALLTLAIRRRLGDARETVLVESPAVERSDVRRSLLVVAAFSLAAEVVAAIVTGALLLGAGEDPAAAAGHGGFHAMMAFNNAGFALWNGPLVDAPGGIATALVLAATLTVGGLGPIVWTDLRAGRGRTRRVSLHTRVTLWTSLVLLLGGALAITGTEWTNPATLGAQPVAERPLDALAQSATARSAGFDMVTTADQRPETLVTTQALMFVGAGTGGTGGGIKVTTLFVIVLAIWSELRGRSALEVAGRELPPPLLRQAVVVTALGAVLVLAGTLAIEAGGPWTLEQSLFEATSAFSTTGLTTGVTPRLSLDGKIVDMALMFLGRVGPLTLAAALALRERPRRYRYPEERVRVG